LGQHCEIFSGYPFKSHGYTDDPGDIPLVKGENIGQGEVLWEISKRWPIQDMDELDRYKLIEGDVVLAMDRPWVPAGLKFAKITATAPQALLVQRVARLRVRQGLDQSFLAQLIASPNFVGYVQSVCRGVGVPHISGKEIGSFEFFVPSLVEQEKIASILSAYDDLIDNNRRRMALLEDSARQLYREWFVRLRFPGHEHTPNVESVPQGWRKVPLAQITSKIGSGATPKGGEAAYQLEGVTLIRSMNVYDDLFDDAGLAFLNDDQAAGLANVVVEPNDILLNITGASVARCCMAPERYLPARVNQHVMIIRVDPKKASPFFVHKAVNSDECKRLLLSFARKGSTREALTKEEMANFEITIPTSALMEQFGEIAADAYAQREGLAKQNQKLRQARDLLLPRLMSGELIV
jgi:type I restriction enzyme S subunit